MMPETEHIVTTQILALVQGIENRLRIALETLVLQLWQAKTLHAKAVGICKVCRAEPANPFAQIIVNSYGTRKEIGPDKQIIRIEPSTQKIYRVLKRLGKTRNRPVRGKSARQKASNLVAQIQQTAPLLWVGKAAIMRSVDFKGLKAMSRGRRAFGFDLDEVTHVSDINPIKGHWEWLRDQAELKHDIREHPEYYAKLARGEDVSKGIAEYGPVFKKRQAKTLSD